MTQTQSHNSSKAQATSEHPLAKMHRELLQEWRDSGDTVVEMAESDGQELTASVPQGKRPKSNSATSQDGPTTAEIEAAVQRVNDLHHGTAKL